MSIPRFRLESLADAIVVKAQAIQSSREEGEDMLKRAEALMVDAIENSNLDQHQKAYEVGAVEDLFDFFCSVLQMIDIEQDIENKRTINEKF